MTERASGAAQINSLQIGAAARRVSTGRASVCSRVVWVQKVVGVPGDGMKRMMDPPQTALRARRPASPDPGQGVGGSGLAQPVVPFGLRMSLKQRKLFPGRTSPRSRSIGMATPCLSKGIGKTCREAAGSPRVRSRRSGRGHVMADGAGRAPVPRISVGEKSRSLPIRGMGASGRVASGAGHGGEPAAKIDGPGLPMALLAVAQVGFGWGPV